MTPTKIFKKASSAYDLAIIVTVLFWMPLLALGFALLISE
jgi:hypothetical protein